MTRAASVKGRWRIVEMQLWDKDFLDMMEPAYIVFDGKSGGEFGLWLRHWRASLSEISLGRRVYLGR